ncbi:MAG: DUF3793 family protein [Selenomonadaceae bacterium]|nr:DUF3793 family protein [Selenomonadaceae bacterium]
MAKEDFEQVMGMHAAPMLWGVKAANMVSFRKSSFGDFDALLESYEPCFRCKGISVFRVSEGEEYVLLLFYRQEAMWRTLHQPKAMELLERFGYRREDTLDELLERLKIRMQVRKTFPHEVGLFLGYPPDDVVGFIENKGQNYAFSGYWKVYANEQRTKALFDLYTDCSQNFCLELEKGRRFEELVRAV